MEVDIIEWKEPPLYRSIVTFSFILSVQVMFRVVPAIQFSDPFGVVTVIFPSYINHKDIGSKMSSGEVLSAGFCQISEGKFSTFGRSQSLNLESREEDSGILNMMVE